jgi:hypothetical protein
MPTLAERAKHFLPLKVRRVKFRQPALVLGAVTGSTIYPINKFIGLPSPNSKILYKVDNWMSHLPFSSLEI